MSFNNHTDTNTSCVILAALNPKLNVFCPFSTISYFKHFNQSSPPPLQSVGGGEDICAR